MPNELRTALLIRCTREEAERIHHEAKMERRTLSGYVLNAVMNRIESRQRLLEKAEGPQRDALRAVRNVKS